MVWTRRSVIWAWCELILVRTSCCGDLVWRGLGVLWYGRGVNSAWCELVAVEIWYGVDSALFGLGVLLTQFDADTAVMT